MGTDTKGFVHGQRSYEEIYETVKSVYPNAEIGYFQIPGTKTYKDRSGTSISYEDSGFMKIDFEVINAQSGLKELRSLSVIAQTTENNFNLPNLGVYTWLSFGKWGESVEIMENIIKAFGSGILIPDDCAAYDENFQKFINVEESKILSDADKDFLNAIGYEEVNIYEKLIFLKNIKKYKDAIKLYYAAEGE